MRAAQPVLPSFLKNLVSSQCEGNREGIIIMTMNRKNQRSTIF